MERKMITITLTTEGRFLLTMAAGIAGAAGAALSVEFMLLVHPSFRNIFSLID
jgi:hypothetical protein